MAQLLSPYPRTSPVVNTKTSIITIDWDKWLNDLSLYVTRLLNRYETLKSGLATLVAGTVVIANTNVTATSYIRHYRQTAGGTLGELSIVLNPGVGFTINSSAAETSTVFYEIVEAF